MTSTTSRAVRESRCAVGSSASTSAGAVTSARASPTRCCWPPLSSAGRWCARSCKPRSSSNASTRRARSRAESGSSVNGSATFSAAVSTGTRLCAWKTNPTFATRKRVHRAADMRPTFTAPIQTSPQVGTSSPPRRARSVLLPLPEGPTIAQSAPGASANDTSRTAWTVRPATANCLRRPIARTADIRSPRPMR